MQESDSLHVALARVETKLDGVIQRLTDTTLAIRESMSAGDSHNAQAIVFVEASVKRAHLRIDAADVDRDHLAGRVDMIEQWNTARSKQVAIDVEELKQWRSNLTGRMWAIGVLVTVTVPLLTALALKAIGG